ncbi:MAG: Uma2 family endonuclease [Armatimonadetes bacterium]|nr:Uma2 family endonuclease [Armatimonadota bacterium]
MTLVVHENRFLTTTDWAGYTRFLEAVGEGHTKVTYDRGALELLTPSPEHEHTKTLMRALLECYLEERDVDFVGGGSTTFRDEDLDRGLEPDECYWVGEIVSVVGMLRFDPAVHRPPDLALEVDVTSSSLDRLGIYAALGIPEVWRYLPRERSGRDRHGLRLLRLAGQTYAEQPASPLLPGMDFQAFLEHLELGRSLGQNKMLRSFRRLVR